MTSQRVVFRLVVWFGFLGVFPDVGCLAQDATTGRKNQSITGGTASVGYREVVALVVGEAATATYRCSGVLIASDAVLTAAHCLGGSLVVFIGDSVDETASGTFVAVDRQIAHPLWVGEGNEPLDLGQANDIGVLTLGQAVDTPPVLLIRPSDTTEAFSVSSRVTISGFGAVESGGEAGARHEGTAQITQVGDFEMLISAPNEPQACDGDSGGPALWRDGSGEVLGIVSREPANATECTGGAIYTRVDAYEEFIRDNVALPCGSGSTAACDDGGRDSGSSSSDAASVADSKTSAPPNTGVGPPITSNPKPIRDDGGCSIAGPSGQPLALIAFPLLLALALIRLRRRCRRRSCLDAKIGC